jgi:hypothetical protein
VTGEPVKSRPVTAHRAARIDLRVSAADDDVGRALDHLARSAAVLVDQEGAFPPPL